MSENEASSLAAELSRDEDLPPFLRLKNDLRVAVQVLRVDPARKTRIFHTFSILVVHFREFLSYRAKYQISAGPAVP